MAPLTPREDLSEDIVFFFFFFEFSEFFFGGRAVGRGWGLVIDYN